MRKEARRAERRSARAPSTVRHGGIAPVDVTVEDISRTGIRFVSDGSFAVGDTISIGLAGVGTTAARVTWARDGQFGCAFDQPIPDDALARAFTARTVVQWSAPAGPAGEQARAQARAAVDEIYQRHRMWSLPVDVVAITIIAMLLLGAIGWRWIG